MHSSYKKRLYTNALSLSTAVLLAFLAQGQVAADTVEPASPATPVENVLKPEETSTSPASSTEATNPAPATEATASPARTGESSPTASDTASPTAKVEAPVTERAANAEPTISLTDSPIYMSEKGTLTDTVKDQAQAAGKINWTLDDKPLEEWKTWDMETGTLSKDPFITVEENKNGNDLDLTFTVKELFGEDLSLRSPNNIRRTYRNYIGEHTLVGTSADLGLTIRKNLTFRPYKDFHTHEEMLASIEQTKAEAKTDRLVQLETLGKSAQGRDMKMGIVSKDQASIDHYLSSTNPKALTKPSEMLAALKDKTLDYKLPVLVHNTHADEQPGIDIITGLFRTFATEDQVTFKTTDEAGNVKNVTLDIPTLLNKFIFLFDFTENPDGDALNLRAFGQWTGPKPGC